MCHAIPSCYLRYLALVIYELATFIFISNHSFNSGPKFEGDLPMSNSCITSDILYVRLPRFFFYRFEAGLFGVPLYLYLAPQSYFNLRPLDGLLEFGIS